MSAAAFASALIGFGDGAMAEQGDVPEGAAVVTSFSGVKRDPASGAPVLDPEGQVLRVLDLSSPGFAANGSRWDDVPLTLDVTARESGQVFGIAIDGARPPTIYLAASSAFGLYRAPDNSGWMAGMWGRGGGPGTVYRLRAANGYRPEPFAALALDGRPNSGVGLGNIAFDASNDQLFVSDLENGMIYRIDAASGTVLDHFDHGVDGRAYYLDSASAQYRVGEVVPFDPASAARIADCGTGPAGQAAARFNAQPACWNIADFRRRVYGLGVQTDAETGEVRLYYAVWGAQGFGNPQWDPATEDAQNSIWSVGLDEAGSFDLQSVRREFDLPPFFVMPQDRQAHGASHPVTDIAFSQDDVMFVAERGGLRGAAQPGAGAATSPRGARVLAFARGEDGMWAAQGRLDVGYDARGALGPPYLRAGAAGGVALGFGYSAAGQLDQDAPETVVWMTGDALCSTGAPCPLRGGTGSDPRPTTGLQGAPLAAVVAVITPDALAPPTVSGPGPASVGPDASYMIGLGRTTAPLAAGQVGDVEIYQAATGEPAASTTVPDLGVAKSVLAGCGPNQLCRFRIAVTNTGSTPYAGPIVLSDDVTGALRYRAAAHGRWRCAGGTSHVVCYSVGAPLAPGAQLMLDVEFLAPGNIATTRVRNCVELGWLGRGGRDPLRVVQLELATRGFDPGLADGIMGPRTRAAIRAAERSLGLSESGEVSDALLSALFGPDGLRGGDAVQSNNRSCAYADIDIPPPPAHLTQLSAFHRRYVSAMHDARTSGPVTLHNPAISSFHLRYRSSMHDGVTTRSISLHRTTLSLFHRSWTSSRHDPRTTRRWQSHSTALSIFHRTLGSGLHNTVTSLRIPDHRTALSAFHRSHRSAQHDPRTTRERQVHSTALSAFHRSHRSAQHDPRTTRERQVHSTALSAFHRSHQSAQHDPRTTREHQVHGTALSAFHRSHQSAQHDPRTTRERQVHGTALSAFHRSHQSAQHDPRTTREHQVHGTALSAFHRSHQSAQHDPRTTRERQVHGTALSAFHRSHQSAQHDPRTTREHQVHGTALSAFHRSHQSAQHDPRTSRERDVHNTALSTFHRSHQSAQHDPRTSRERDVHNTALSTFHRSHQSAQHDSRTTRERQVHSTALSTFHRIYQSAQHDPRTSRIDVEKSK
ncbi:peptidoglycan-binding protein [Acidimangrovimonas pyrenivorans]|uniref:Peptidoglycan-binding protein n=1 Tax=Acidimangrovimonas pyrenivorans TaxID=2030798 RepID=A0ABV7AFV3_9RHOB